jgi:hypothetical protein
MDLAGDPRNFSIVLGGPLFQLFRKAHMAGDALELARRRIVAITAFTWLPLLLLSLAQGMAWGGVAVPFLQDAQAHSRFLLAVPLMVAAEMLVHMRIRPIAEEFLVRRLVPDEALERFHECVRSAFRWRNSMAIELALVALVYGVGVPVLWRHYAAIDVPTWYATPGQGISGLTLAGWWYAFVSVPIFQFLLLRWYFRIAIWIRFLWQVSRLPLRLSALNADLSAGLGFLSGTVFAFVPLLMAHGALVAGTLANRIFHAGGTLMEGRYEVAFIVGYLLVLVVAPLVVFAPAISAAKRRTSREYTRLSQRYVVEFEGRWLPGGLPASDSPLGTADVQSLADLNSAMDTVRATRTVPISKDAIVKLAVATLAPVAPLLLTVIPAEELVTRLFKLVF